MVDPLAHVIAVHPVSGVAVIGMNLGAACDVDVVRYPMTRRGT